MTKDTIHADLMRDVLGPRLSGMSDTQAQAWMILFHLYEIHLRPGVRLDDVDLDPIVLAADTRRAAASTIASVWPDRSDPSRTGYIHWYWELNTKTPYESVCDLPPEWLERVESARAALKNHPLVADVVQED